jgi:hypothetical protein
MLVKPDVAQRQIEADAGGAAALIPGGDGAGNATGALVPGGPASGADDPTEEPTEEAPPNRRRFHGTVQLDPTRAGRDASRIADEIIAHLAGQVGAEITVTLEIEAILPGGASDQIFRTVTENSRTLNFTSHGFENE